MHYAILASMKKELKKLEENYKSSPGFGCVKKKKRK